MKTIEREEVKKIIVGYESTDGTYFKTQEECEKYERSALGVLKGRLAQRAIRVTTEYGLFEAGCDDTDAFVLVPKSKDDIDLINQFLELVNGDRASSLIEDDKIGAVGILFYNRDGECAWYYTVASLVEQITAGKYGIVEKAEE